MRTKKGILNFASSYIFYIVLAILGFIKIRIFVDSLGESLYALNQLYVNLFSYLTLAEAGIGTVFMYKLYKKLANKDYDAINLLYSGTKTMFKKIGFIIILVGFVFAFFIPLFIKNNNFSSIYLFFTFMLFIGANVVDYFMMVPRYIIQADQNQYQINMRYYIIRVIEILIQILLLKLSVDYIVILIPSIIIAIIQNKWINQKIFKLYPWLKYKKENQDYSTKSDIKHMIVHRIVGLITHNIDIVILSAFVNSAVVTIYASYNYLSKFAIDTTAQVFNALKDGLGNALEIEEKSKIKDIINEFFVLFSYIASVVVVILFFITNDFVNLWLGKKYVVEVYTLILFLIIVYYQISIRSISIIKTTMGLFKETKIMAAVEAIINLTLSLILVHKYNLNGVLIGTIIAFLLTNFWYLPYIVYKKLFNENICKYMTTVVLNILIVIVVILIFIPLQNRIFLFQVNNNIFDWLLYSIFCMILTILFISFIYYLIYPSFKTSITRIKKLFFRRKREKNIKKNSI